MKVQTRFHPHRTDADPFKTFRVNPESITRAITDGAASGWGMVESGDWDKEVEPFKERSYCRAIETLVEKGDDGLLRRELARIPDYASSPRYGSGGVEDRIDEILDLKEALEKHGYRSQRELLRQDDGYHRAAANDQVPAYLNEILVDIGRDGELLYRWCGQNRLRLSQLLELDSVVVMVARRHREWQSVRDEVRRVKQVDELSNNVGEALEHPDLQDLSA